MLTILLGFSTLQVSAQQIVEIGTGTETTYYGPYNSLWGYSFVEQIYTAEEIDMTGTITSISFNNNHSSGETNNITVYMKLVNRSSFSSTSDYETVTAADIVYTGSHNFSNGWSTINLDTPFDYDGVSNLMIAVHEYTSGYTSQSFYYTSTTANTLISFHSDNSDPDPYNLGSFGGNSYTQTYRPNVRLEIMPSGNTCYTPLSPAVSNVTAYEATLSWTPRENQTNWEVYCGTGIVDLDQVSWTPVTDTFYTFTGLTPATNYTAYVRTVCGSEVSNPRQVTFATEATCPNVPTSVTVSGITATTADVNWASDPADNAWEVVVVPSSMTPEDGIPEQTTTKPYTVTNLSDNTQYKVYVRTDCGGGDYSYWSSAATFTTLPLCSVPLDVTVSQITAGSALVSWQPAVFGANSYTVGYKLSGESDYTTESVDGLQYMLSNLEPDSSYNVIIYSNCDEGTADTVFKTFTTKHCYAGGDLSLGEGTSSFAYLPEYCLYNYSYTQQIYLASEMNGATAISSIAFNASSIANANRHLKIYLMHTSAASSNWLPASGAQLVYDNTPSLAVGWNTFNFTTPFQYNGTDNLAVIVVDVTGSWSGTNYFYCHTTTQNLSRYIYQDDSEYTVNSIPSGGSETNMRNNVIFGCDCNNDITCIRPNVYVSETGETSITLDWAPGLNESAWDVEYTTDTTWISAGTANAHPYEVSNLNADTRYYFRVRSNCGSDVSEWSMTTARTDCGAITQLPYFNNFDEVITDNGTAFVTCWSRYTTDPSRVVRCYGSATHSGSYSLDFNFSPSCTTAAVTPMLDSSIPLNTVMLDFWAYSTLGQGWMEVGTMSDPNDFSTYEFYDTVRLSAANTWNNVIISFGNYTGNNQYIAFLEINGTSTSYILDDFTIDLIPNCVHPTGLTVNSVDNSAVTLSWTEPGNATSWTIEYGSVGFTPGTGTQVTADQIPFTVDNLTTTTPYDFYVYSDCSGLLSEPFGPVQATPGQYVFGTSGSDTLTTCLAMLYDNGGFAGNYGNNSNFTLVLYPENPNARMALVGTLSTESCCDSLSIRDGVGTSGPWLAGYKGENQNVNVLSQSGPLTLIFHSDGSVVSSGFAITASCETCYPPTNITCSNPTIDGVTVSWSGVGDSYVLFLDGDMTTGYSATGTTYTFTGLNASTLYSVQIASVCGGDTSILSSAVTFATACGAVTITADNPWEEDFEAYVSSEFICWDTPVTYTADNGTFPMVYRNYGQASHSGGNSAELKGPQLLLVLPEFTNNIQDLRLSFWATATSTSTGSIQVGVITDLDDLTTFEPVATAGTPGPRGSSAGGNGNYMGPFAFNNAQATTGRLALLYTDITATSTPGASGNQSWNLDDFTVELIPSCPSPVKASVTASNIGGHVATITWVDNDASHTAWTVYYKKSSETEWSTEPATATTVTLTGLDPVSTYDVYVVTNCGTPENTPDATFTINFTTTIACPAPTGLTLANVSTDEATITWNGTASSYNVEYGQTGFAPGTGTTEVAYTESITLTNLVPSTSYTIYVNSDCNDNNDSLSTTVSFSFTTTQIPAALPYTADFTQTNEWLLNNGSCTNYWAVGTLDTVPSLFVTNNGTSAGYNMSSTSIVSAEKLLAVGDHAAFSISFDVNVGGESSYDYLKVFFAPAENSYPAATSTPSYADYSYSTNAIDFSNYLSQTGSSLYPYKLNLTQGNTLHVSVEMPNPNDNATSASTAKLVFVWKNDASAGTQPGAIISNVNVSAISCPTPTNLAVTNLTSNSVTLSWTPGDQETNWEIAYGPAGFDPDDNTEATIVTATSNPFDVQNLTPSTPYDFYVRAMCSANEQSGWTLSATHATTLCSGSVALPYTENFDSYTTSSTYSDNNGIAPDCWTTYSTNTTYGAPHITSDGSYHYVSSGTNSMVFTCGSAGADAYAALPEFDQPLNTLHLNFWRAMESTYSGTLTVGYVTNPGDLAGSFVQVAAIPSVSNDSGDTISVDFSNLNIATGYICFHWNYSSSYYSCCIDDISVTSGSSGPAITDPTVATNAATAIGQTNATLNATVTNPDNVTLTAKGFEWKTTTGGTYTQIAGTGTGNTFTANLTNLAPNTNYTFKAFVTFNGQTVYGNEMTFTTLPEDTPDPCNVPTGLTATDVQGESVSITWDDNADVSSWNIQYRPEGGQLSTASSTTNSYTITGLTGGTTYQIQVQANCGDGNLSDWSSAITVTTTGIENWLENSVTLFPNPAREYVDIRIDGELNVTVMEVYDVYGKLINTVNVIDNPTRINVSNLANGMYFVRVTTEAGAVTKTFVKR